MKHTAILCIGSNVGPREVRIEDAIERMEDLCRVISKSRCSESDDITGKGAPYLNMAVLCATDLGMDDFLARISEIEVIGGRRPDGSRIGVVDIDIDLVVWDGSVVSPDDFSRDYFIPLYKALSDNK